MIQDRACPRCGILRTVRWSTRQNVCMNCHLYWGAVAAPARLRATRVRSDPHGGDDWNSTAAD